MIEKIAVLADIHGNLPALQEVISHIDQWSPDAVVVAGDVVNRGPRPRECLQIILERQRGDGWLVVRGNHEDYVINHARPNASRSGPEFEIYQMAYWTANRLNGQVSFLEEMPFQVSLRTPCGEEIRSVHASMRGNRDGIYPDTPDDDLRLQIAPPPAVLCVGHTHRPLIRSLDSTLVVNVGSVGLPFDGDNRAAYAQLTRQEGQLEAKIIRLPYDSRRMERDFFDTGFAPDAGPISSLILVEFRHSRPFLSRWMHHYQKAVLTGDISAEKAVSEFITTIEN